MEKNSYGGWTEKGTPVVAFYTGERVIDIITLGEKEGFRFAGVPRWGDESEASRFVGTLLLWHASGDIDLVNDLATIFTYDVIRNLGPTWTIPREWVRDWLQLNQKFRLSAAGYPFNWITPCRN